MFRRLCLSLVPLACLVLLGCGEKAPPPKGSNNPPVVEVSLPVQDPRVVEYEDFTGRMEASRAVEVRARVTGYLQKLHFKDGQEVKEGQLLFEIDPRTLAATYAQTEANLRLAETHLKRLNYDFGRARQLLPKKGISREEYDKISGDRDEAESAVGVAVANRDFARINLQYCKVLAPISGRISRRMMDPGNTVKADETALTTIIYLDEMYVNFDINERCFLRIQDLIKKGEVQSLQDNRTPIKLRLADEKEYDHRGTIDFTDNRLDASTGTYRVRAVVENRDRYFSPGLFVRVRLEIGLPHKAILVSDQALGSNQGEKFLYVVNAQKKVEKRTVEVGRLHKGRREITKGLKPDEYVVVRGLQRVRDDVKVTPKIVPMPQAVPSARKRSPQKPPAATGKQTGPAGPSLGTESGKLSRSGS
jgi:RND family efflux transporter MFP subunit